MTQPLESLIRRLRRTTNPPGDGMLLDAHLLSRWADQRDEAAFELLLRRHGPMVLSACRRLLADAYAAEDAFQATWLLFLRHAGAIRQPEALAAWLHRVACRVGRRARAMAARRQNQERPGVEALAVAAPEDPAQSDLRAILDEEIDRLPGHYRQALVLCALQGKTYAEAARELGRPQGTVASWAARARERLRGRLGRRGVILGAGALAAGAEAAALPAPLVTSTVHAATAIVAGGSVPVLPIAAALAREVNKLMFFSKCRTVVATLLLLLLAAAGVVALAPPPQKEPPPNADPRLDPPAPSPAPDAARPRAALERTLKLDSPVKTIAFAPDSQTLACGGLDGTVQCFESQTGKVRQVLRAGEERSLAFAPDGKLLADAQSGKTVLLWDIQTGEPRHRLAGHGSFVSSVAFSPDGRTLASGSASVDAGKLVGEVKLWEVRTGELQRTLRWEGVQVWCVAFAPDGDTVAAGGGGGGDKEEILRLWDLRTGTEKKTRKRDWREWVAALPSDDLVTRSGTGRGLAEVYCLAYAPDGQSLAVGGNNAALLVLEAKSLQVTRALMGPRNGHQGTVGSVSFSPDSKVLVSGSGDKTAKLWDPGSGKLLQSLEGHEGTVNAVALSADGRMLATGGEDGTVRLWKVNKQGTDR
jgi:RNA polymerase sigma factor (sigma-70 family)